MGQVIRIELVEASQAETVLQLALEAFEEFRETLTPPPGILAETVTDVTQYIDHGGAVLAWTSAKMIVSEPLIRDYLTTYPVLVRFVALRRRASWAAASPVPNEWTLLTLIRSCASSARNDPFLALPGSMNSSTESCS